MKIRALAVLCFASFFPFSAFGQCGTGTSVTFNTVLGNMNLTLLPNAAPVTVANFLNYYNNGSYTNSIIHRSVPGFVIQGGGYNSGLGPIAAAAAIKNEFGLSNVRGTIAMALTSNQDGVVQINSATNEFFFNLADNSATLDPQSFTVFGCVADAASLAVMDAIAAVPVIDYNSTFTNLPVRNYTSGATVTASNLVVMQQNTQSSPVIPSNGVISASGFGAYTAAAVGSFVEIYGTNLSLDTMDWSNSFVGSVAPTILDGVTVEIAGIPAYINFVSPGQVNVQVPQGVANGSASVVLTNRGQASAAVNLSINTFEGGLLAPASWNVGGKQYVVALHAKDYSFVTSGNIPGITGTPAVPGETLVFYGIGFGAVTISSTPLAGQLLTTPVPLANTVQFQFGSVTGKPSFEGLTTEVGVYQFNIMVPYGLPSGDIQLTATQSGSSVTPQTLWIPIQ